MLGNTWIPLVEVRIQREMSWPWCYHELLLTEPAPLLRPRLPAQMSQSVAAALTTLTTSQEEPVDEALIF